MNKKSSSSEPARQVSLDDVKHLEENNKLIDKTYFQVSNNGKTSFSKKPFIQAD